MSNLTVQAPLEEPARQEYFMEMAKKQVAQLSRELGRPLTCCINTFGCQMNTRRLQTNTRILCFTTPVRFVKMQT